MLSAALVLTGFGDLSGVLKSPETLLGSSLLPAALPCAGTRASPGDRHLPRTPIPGSAVRPGCQGPPRKAERGSFALSGLCEEEVCRADSSGQVNSGQMEPRYLPGDTRRAGFAQPGRLFALGRAFPSIRRQQRCRDVTPGVLLGSSVTLLARCLHLGCGCCCGTWRLRCPSCHQPGYRGLISHSQGSA